MKEIVGGFFFRDEGDGCITGKYVNNMSSPFAEAAKLQPGIHQSGPFLGIYDTVWLETSSGATRSITATLTITRDARGNYDLKWHDGKHVLIFEGVGMLSSGLLIGGYWSL